jgi:hypothetical protein
MSIIKLLSTSLGNKSEIPNQKLAEEIVFASDTNAISEIIENLQFNKDKGIQSDCIKVLYEIGYKKPELIAEYLLVFIKLLNHKNNRLIWGSMIAISTIADVSPENVYARLSEIMQAIDKGSVITIDAGVEILSKLAAHNSYRENCFTLFLEQLKKCPPKQLGQYAEKAFKAIDSINNKELSHLLNTRKPELENDAQIKRINAILKKIESTYK